MNFNLDIISAKKVLVVGDVMLDRYTWGKVDRISPEAPVPVVRIQKKTNVLGGAGNVAANLVGLNCQAVLLGVCGADGPGNLLKELLKDKKIKNHLLIDNFRPTITKNRIMALDQQLFRLDEEELQPLSNELKEEIIDVFKKKIKDCQAVIISDYGKGLFESPVMCQKIIALCRQYNIPVIVDPKGNEWEKYKGATCITPNTSELEFVIGTSFKNNEKALITSAISVVKKCKLDWLMVTRGPKGMCLIDSKNKPFFIPTRASQVFDVSGAGDTVIATLAACLAAGIVFREAAEIANKAAGIVVGKLGTQPITKLELNVSLKSLNSNSKSSFSNKISTLDSAEVLTKSWKANGEKIVFIDGCFDLLHSVHIELLHKAFELGNRLIVGLNSDASLNRLKGEGRPIIMEQDLAIILSVFNCVDLVIVFDQDTPLELIKKLQPDTFVKGNDYQIKDVVELKNGGHVNIVSIGMWQP